MAEILLTAANAAEIIIEVWSKIEERIEEQEVAEALAADLSEFGITSKRVALQTDVEIAQKVVRDLSAPAERRKDLEVQFQRVYQQLQSIPPAIEKVVKNQNRGVPFKYFHPQANRKLAKIVESYRTSFRDFDQAVIRADAATRGDFYLLIQPGEMKVVGDPPEVSSIGDAISVARVSYTAFGANESGVAKVLWETLASNESTWAENDSDMRVLSAALSGALPHWHIPRLRGYERNKSSKTMRLVFEHPDPTRELCTLSDVYEAAATAPSLTIRVRLCYQLALAVLHAHKPRINVVHKHIRPGNLLLAVPKVWKIRTGELVIPQDWRGEMDRAGRAGFPSVVDLFLSGWQNARTTVQATRVIGEGAPHRIMYQHPQRHQTNTVEKYNIGHDIYSLGVCMLELLTWEPLVSFDETTGGSRLSDAYQAAFCEKEFDTKVEIPLDGDVDLAQLFTQDPNEIKETIIEIAKTRLALHAGDRLANLVCRCLTCLDPVPMYGGSRFHDGDNKNQISETFSREIFSDLNKLLDVLEVAASTEDVELIK
ncbi:uncharacterized protein B0H64DRAFT_157549 [Chaetomium fimeti]|uniref:Protein kinase domain-containing protein n=1 Tax=Chaetomium fimeti TaxID=1854472 RepID=A0AAE0HGF7_9PEZI|nr:hypothetical protein B0H64DRAFT_157549 [Chaetomium fimeti]